MNDYDVVTLTAGQCQVVSLGSDTAKVQISKLEFDAEAAERGGYPHFMLKEIFEQPRTVENAMRGRLNHDEATSKFGGLNMSLAELREVEEIKASQGPIIALATEGNTELAGKVDDIIYLPATAEPLFPLLGVLPLQLLAYHIAVARGCDVEPWHSPARGRHETLAVLIHRLIEAMQGGSHPSRQRRHCLATLPEMVTGP